MAASENALATKPMPSNTTGHVKSAARARGKTCKSREIRVLFSRRKSGKWQSGEVAMGRIEHLKPGVADVLFDPLT